MMRFRWVYLAMILATLGFSVGPAGEWGMPAAQAQEPAKGETLRPEVGKPLQAAQDLLKAQKYKEALSKIAEAESIGNKTAYEVFIIDRMRGAVAASSGDTELAIKSFEAIIASGRLPAPDQLKMIQAVAGTYYRVKNYGQAAAWSSRYFKEGGTDTQMRTLLVQSYYLGNDFANAAKELITGIQAAEQAGQTPAQDLLLLLANSYLKQNDNAGYATALEKLVTYYPKKEYWADLINRMQRRPGFADRLSLDAYRLQLATGNLSSAAHYMDMAQLAIQAGFPIEAKKTVDQGYASGVLGTGSEAERQKRLRDLATKQAADDQKTLAKDAANAAAAPDGTGLVNVGFALVSAGQFDQGLGLMEQGLGKGGLKRPEDAKLHLGIAYLMAGQKAKAIQTLKTVQGADGAADLARLWILHAHRSAS